MSELKTEVYIYDPAVPFKSFPVEKPAIDTWHHYVLITRETWDKIPRVRQKQRATLFLSGGMSMSVPLVEIGLQIGTIRIERIEAAVVDEGYHGILLGSDILNHIFMVGETEEGSTRVTSKWKDDPLALAIELYPLKTPVELRSFESFLKYQRQLYNIILICSGMIPTPPVEDLGSVIRDEHLIPQDLRLKLAWIDSGSIWITLKSSSGQALKTLSSLFETSATAELAQQLDVAAESEDESGISQATRDATATRISEEQQRLSPENLSATYQNWRDEIRERLSFADDLIAQVSNKEIAAELKRQKDQIILQIVGQMILPVVRNIPRAPDLPEGLFLLPPPNLDE